MPNSKRKSLNWRKSKKSIKGEVTMNRKQKILSTAILMAFVLCLWSTADAAAVKHKDKAVADVMIGSSGITWTPKVNYAKLILTVARPDGSMVQKTFDSGSLPYLDLSSIYGEKFNDGSYTYELRVIPVSPQRIRQEVGVVKGANRENFPRETLTQTGYFQVKDGMIVTPTSTSEDGLSGAMDIVHADDVIIDGSLCVGNDCYSGLEFGFDTIVLMENNLRIFFDDTSTIQNYPRNDWRIICNDSADGGGNYFAIQDATEVSDVLVLEAGAPANSLYVDGHGDVGIGTSTPYYELHIVDGDSPCVRLDQDGSYGWTPQKWDICGNESNFFIRDATHASKLPFRIEPDAPTNSIFIKSDGKVGIGTGAPGYSLEVETTGENAGLYLDRTDGATFKLNVTTSMAQIGTQSNHKVNFVANNSAKMTIDTTGYVGIGTTSPTHLVHLSGGAYSDGSTWQPSCSRSLKENITTLTLDEAVKTLDGLNPVKFNYKINKDEDYIGFIAEDVPELVATKERKSINTMDVVAVLTKVLQDQQKAIRDQQKILQEQQETISGLKKEIAQLKEK
jgi:hypothetical protein